MSNRNIHVFATLVLTTSLIGLLAVNPRIEDSYFYKACSYCQLSDYENAFQSIKDSMIHVEESSNDMLKLFGRVAVARKPPLFDDAVHSFNMVIEKNEKNFDMVRKETFVSNYRHRSHCRVLLSPMCIFL